MSLIDPNVNAVSLSDSVHVVALTNHELFTTVVAAIKRSFKQKKSSKKDWHRIAIKVATSAAMGEDGYCGADDWVNRFHELSGSDQDESDTGPNNFGEALKALPDRDCYRRRLKNALDCLASSSASKSTELSIKQAVGLIRGSAFLIANVDDDVHTLNNDCQLQAHAISILVQSMPQLATSNPCDIFLAVQLPLLQKIHWDAFINGGIKFSSADAEAEFRSLLHVDFDESHVHAGAKRRRLQEDTASSHVPVFSKTHISYLLEAAHLARNGAVRAQHGAVIFLPSEDGGTTVIGRGWNHDYLLDRSKSKKNKIVLHSEVHAVVDAMRNHGEDKCFDELFPRSTIMIVELESDFAYDTCHPCPKCDPLLRAVGIPNVLHTTPHGKVEVLDLSTGKENLLSNENVSIPLRAACDEQEISCKRLQAVCVLAK